MTTVEQLRATQGGTLVIGLHHAIVQSMLDYDFLCGAPKPSVVAIVSHGRKQERFFWGTTEIELPVYDAVNSIPHAQLQSVMRLLNLQSGRSVLVGVKTALDSLPNAQIVSVFAEQVPESHALELAAVAQQRGIILVGPASVGALVPGVLKLGAIGGITHAQITQADICKPGDTAIISTSGGMVNELIHTVTQAGLGVSIAFALGGDRFAATTPLQACLLAQADPQTARIVYFGELGGEDEHALASAVRSRSITKPIFAYVAGVVAELFETPPQFGHAKALAGSQSETAAVKKHALRSVGVTVVESFAELGALLGVFSDHQARTTHTALPIAQRSHALLSSHISGDIHGTTQLLGNDLLTTVNQHSLASLVLSMLLGQTVTAPKLVALTDFVLRLLADHGPYVSGAANTIVTARAGKDLVSSLTAGLLTIGPRFGGSINQAAVVWLDGVQNNTDPKQFVEEFKAKGGIIPGIGHKKYRLDHPDPRVTALYEYAPKDSVYLQFAQAVQAVTTAKKSNLVLNVDGVVAAVLLDCLSQELQYSPTQLRQLADIEFFNALFVLSRSIGFSAHYLDQRRHDEGLVRLTDREISYLPERS